MLRILVIGILSALLANCSGSSRLEEIVPDWANTPPRHPTAQYAAPKNQSQGRTTLAAEPRATPAAEPRGAPAAAPRGAPAAEPQETKKTEGQSPSEE
jgi:hypothetical protein